MSITVNTSRRNVNIGTSSAPRGEKGDPGPQGPQGPQGDSGVAISGSNANGEFVRYADGTQICSTTIDVGNSAAAGDGTFPSPYRSADFTWNFPASFVDAPVVAGAVSGNDNGIIRTHVFSLRFVTNTQISQARAVRIGSNDANFPVIAHIVAHGYWF